MSQNTSSTLNIKSQPPKTAQNTRKPGQPKRPRKITESYLHNSGLYYLERYASSAANFETVMLRKIKKSCAYHEDQDYETCAALLPTLIEKFIRLELLNDDLYTRTKLRALRQRGKSKRAIVNYLKAKGIAGDLVQKHWTLYNQEHEIQDDQAEYETAMIFARKKRLGPFRISDKVTPDQALGRFARAGFSYDTARRVLNLESEDF